METTKLIILGAGKPHYGKQPSALLNLPGNKRVIDWIIDAFSDIQLDEIHFVGGYEIDQVIAAYPDIRFTINPLWENTGCLQSLLLAPIFECENIYVTYADVVFRKSIVSELSSSKSDAVIVADSAWRNRYENRSNKDLKLAEKITYSKNILTKFDSEMSINDAHAEFIGLMKLSRKSVESISKLNNQNQNNSLGLLFEHFQKQGINTNIQVTKGEWAELNKSQDVAKYVLGSKAATLSRIKPLLNTAYIDDQISFSITQWRKNKNEIIGQIQHKYKAEEIVVRSSASTEDTWDSSNAGKFLSLLSIPCSDTNKLEKSIDDVIRSYSSDDEQHEVLIQKYLSNVKINGVVITRTLSNCAPYYVINYAESSDTSAVTAGNHPAIKQITILKKRPLESFKSTFDLNALLTAVTEIEEIVHYDRLDIEFLITNDSIIHIVQIRPIATKHATEDIDDQILIDAVEKAANSYEENQIASPFIKGNKAIYGLMPDWNPAEIIGPKPSILSFSLYRYLITDEIWAKQRAEFGYRDIRPCPLIQGFVGHPYVDVRASFNSFIPAQLDEQISEKLVNIYLDILEDKPHLHDKIEFEVALTCTNFNIDGEIEARLGGNLDQKEKKELKESLRVITVNAFNRVKKDIECIENFNTRFYEIKNSKVETLKKIFLLLDDAKRNGILPFSHLARSAFIATSLLKSLTKLDSLLEEEVNEFSKSLCTVAKEFENDGNRVANGSYDWDGFVEKYGHLRPGTYSIKSRKYSDDPEKYLRPVSLKDENLEIKENYDFEWSNKSKIIIDKAIIEQGLTIDSNSLLSFSKKAIEGREYAKFCFSKSISLVLDLIEEYCINNYIEIDDIESIPINTFLEIYSAHKDFNVKERIKKEVRQNYASSRITDCCELPPLITETTNFFAFELIEGHPNYVTKKNAISESVNLDQVNSDPDHLKNKIILIENADPGYDWIFGCDIAGLITKYGGANSHMTIRASELQIASAIGVGEVLFENLRSANIINLDCGNRIIKIVR